MSNTRQPFDPDWETRRCEKCNGDSWALRYMLLGMSKGKANELLAVTCDECGWGYTMQPADHPPDEDA